MCDCCSDRPILPSSWLLLSSSSFGLRCRAAALQHGRGVAQVQGCDLAASAVTDHVLKGAAVEHGASPGRQRAGRHKVAPHLQARRSAQASCECGPKGNAIGKDRRIAVVNR
jgi:hypothetical protein